MTGNTPAYTVGIDVGGTFTDFVLQTRGPARRRQHKTPTTPHDPAVGITTGLRELAALEELPEREFFAAIDLIVHGTTVATNAVLTGEGARTGLITTRGFRDILQMRRGIRSRKHLYDNKFVAPAPLVPRDLRKVVTERVDVDGGASTPLDVRELEAAIDELRAEGVEAIAVCFLHAYKNPEHEALAKKAVEERLPGVFLSVSSEVLPQIRLYPRISTTVMNAYLGPVVERYMRSLVDELGGHGFGGTLMVMQSNGGLARPAAVADVPASITLSGPAAGPVAALDTVAALGRGDCTVVDMGGTSFDASLVKDGEVQVTREGEINGHSISLPTTHVHTIGAGGGSIAWIDPGGMLRVGPRSAGSVPGPVAYGKGGTEPTVTDADVVLGYIDPDYFLGGRMRLDARRAADAIRERIAEPLGMSVVAAAAGIYEIVNLEMAAGTKNVSVERGYDAREFPMVVAGGAGPVHAGMIAHELEIPTVVVPATSSVLCAAGMLAADLRHDFVRAFSGRFATVSRKRAHALVEEMTTEGYALLAAEGVAAPDRSAVVAADLRYVGQHHEVMVTCRPQDVDPADLEGFARIAEAFHRRHEQLYGFAARGKDLEILSLRVAVVGRRPASADERRPEAAGPAEPAPKGSRPAYLRSRGELVDTPVYDACGLPPGARVPGPCIVEEPTTTIVVPEYYDVVREPDMYVLVAKGHDLAAKNGEER